MLDFSSSFLKAIFKEYFRTPIGFLLLVSIAMPIAIKIKYLLLNKEEEFFLNADDPHLEQTILPPKDLSETNEELPQLKQILFAIISN